jgi:DNA-binding LytR/AlgR family response regulator
MQDLNCFIVDDNPDAIDTIRIHIQQFPNLNLLGFSTSPLEFLAKLREGLELDLLFLDIEMPMIDGIELAQLLPANVGIIYISGHPNYGVEAFEVNSIDYLRKPVSLSRFHKAIDKAFKRKEIQELLDEKNNLLSEPKPELHIRSSDRAFIEEDLFFVPSKNTALNDLRRYTEILYIKGMNTYVELFFTENRKNIFHRTLTSIEQTFPSNFVRVHKSYIINIQHIKSISTYEVHLNSVQEIIPVGSSYKDNVLNITERRTLKNEYKSKPKG